MARILLLLLLVGLIIAEERVRYDGYEVLSVNVTNQEAVHLLYQAESSGLELEFWNEPEVNKILDLHVAPYYKDKFKSVLEEAGIAYEVAIHNLQNNIDAEELENTLLQQQAFEEAGDAVPSVLGRYARTSEIYAWMESLVTQYPTLCKTESIGSSYGGRDVRMLTVSGGGTKPSIFVDATMHAREWITGGVITHVINQLLTTSEGKSLIERYDWYFVPIVNPDGYEYTFTSNRMWRKTRSPTISPRCVGVDLNRNFGYRWEGGDRNPCSQVYAGTSAFSAHESKNIRDAILQRSANMLAFINLHSYGQFFIPPYLSSTVPPPDAGELSRLLTVAARAIYATTGRTYRVTNPSGRGSGIAIDWVKATPKVKYSYIFELRPQSASQGGFIIPPSNIVPNGQEVWAALVAMAAEFRAP